MVYQPSKKELKQIENLTRGYQLIREGLKLIKSNLPKKDRDVEVYSFRMDKNFDKIIKRIHKVLEEEYVDKQFLDIISIKGTAKGNRLKKKKPDAKVNKKTPSKKKNKG